MPGKIQKELKLNRSLAAPEEALLNILKTADVLMAEFATLLKPAGLTPTQFNVMRILRGAEPDGLPCGQIAERLIQKDPDITRLMDRLAARDLIMRGRDTRDRRIVTIR